MDGGAQDARGAAAAMIGTRGDSAGDAQAKRPSSKPKTSKAKPRFKPKDGAQAENASRASAARAAETLQDATKMPPPAPARLKEQSAARASGKKSKPKQQAGGMSGETPSAMGDAGAVDGGSAKTKKTKEKDKPRKESAAQQARPKDAQAKSKSKSKIKQQPESAAAAGAGTAAGADNSATKSGAKKTKPKANAAERDQKPLSASAAPWRPDQDSKVSSSMNEEKPTAEQRKKSSSAKREQKPTGKKSSSQSTRDQKPAATRQPKNSTTQSRQQLTKAVVNEADVLAAMKAMIRKGAIPSTPANPMTVLMVAEKPSIANSIAKALANGTYNIRGGKTPIHEIAGQFEGQPCLYKVASVTGHIFSCDFPPEYSNWDTVEPVSLFTAPTIKNLESSGVYRQLQSEGKGADVLVLWLDCDREGENICFEVIDAVKAKMKKHFNGEPLIFRAKFSAVNKSDIRSAISTLVLPNENEALSVDARQEMDLKVGVAFSRYQTRYFQGRYGDLDASLVSYGPCQTPTLGFCVDRHDEIESFVPKPFWTLDTEIMKAGHKVKLDWAQGRLFNQERVCAIHNTVKEHGMVRVIKVKKSPTSRPRPTPLNTVGLLQHASKTLGMGPYTAMQVAERLYLQGFISYPRTESTSYPDSYDIRGTLSQHATNPYWGNYVQGLLQTGLQKPKKGVDVGDHPPITPVRSATPNDLTGDMARLYDFIARYFIATVSPDATLLASKVKFECGEESFSVTGNVVIDKGFTAVMPSTTLAESVLPEFSEGEVFPIATVDVRKGFTTPPGYLTESELIGLMEKNGIGTDASIPAHINNICERNYVQLGAGRTLVPTPLGIVLVHGYHKVDPELVLPKVRASIEEQCTKVAKGLASKADVLASALAMFQNKFENFVRQIEQMDALFLTTFSPLEATGKPLSKCGKCLRYMKYVSQRPQRLHCAACDQTYNLPQNGTIKLYKELRCPVDNFELVLFSLGNQEHAMGKSYPLCPHCYNFPPYEGVSHMGCNACLHVSCPHSLTMCGVFACPGALDPVDAPPCTGTMVLDVNSKPNWKMACNTCNLLVKFQSAVPIHSIKTRSGTECDECGSTQLEVTFHKDKSPLKDGATQYVGCVLCDDYLNGLTEMRRGRLKHIDLVKRHGGGRGRGRGGRGRGRGRGRARGEKGLMSVYDF